jgi:hypothetical protein
MEQSWQDHYYDSLGFYYGEPQHLSPLRFGAEKGYKFPKVRKRLQRLEVPLNHIITHFFLLAPNAFCNSLFRELFNREFDTDIVLQGDVDKELRLESSMQPDFLFLSRTDVVCIEMKLSAKCCVNQVLKYALLGLAVELHEKQSKRLHFAILGCDGFCKWEERFQSIEEVTEALHKADLTKFLQEQPTRFRDHQERFNGIVEQMRPKYWTYECFSQSLEGAMPSQHDHSPGAEVYRKLLRGLITEFRNRELCQQPLALVSPD